MIQPFGIGALAAFALSVLAHLGGVHLFWTPEQTEIAGGAQATASVRLGNSFQDVVNGVAIAVKPDQAVAPEKPTDLQQNVSSPVVPKTAFKPTKAIDRVDHSKASVSANEPAVSAVKLKPIQPVQATVQIRQARVVQPLQTPNTDAFAVLAQAQSDAPVLSQRPKVRPKSIEALAPKPKSTTEAKAQPTPKSKPKKATRKGTNAKDQVAGSASATKDGSVKQGAKRQGKANQTGNAAASNYAGKVLRKIQPLLRMSGARNSSATVSFSISSGGSVANARVLGGSADLGAKFVRKLRRIKFPKPPPGAQRHFRFTVKS